jgi:hypothetical protein
MRRSSQSEDKRSVNSQSSYKQKRLAGGGTLNSTIEHSTIMSNVSDQEHIIQIQTDEKPSTI